VSQLLVRNGTCVNPDGRFDADVLAEGGKIVAIGSNLNADAERVIDARGRLVLPGGIDVHVHLPWPTGSCISTDNLISGTRAAAFGGVTTVLDFVIPAEESLEEALSRKLAEAEQGIWVDVGFHLTIRGQVTTSVAEIPSLVAAGFPSFKVFLAYEGFGLSDADLLQVMKAVGQAGGILGVHAENGPLADYMTGEMVARGETALVHYPRARDTLCEVEAIQRVLVYAELTGACLHVHHVSTSRGAQLIGEARRRGLAISGETCPHYLVFTRQDYAGDPARASHLVCAPAIKDLEDQQALWRALANGDLSIVATDHCPYTRSQKEASVDDFTLVPGGTAGVETRLPLIFTRGVMAGRLSVSRFVAVWATEPAKLFGLYPQKGIIAVGSDADLVIVDPGQKVILRAATLHMNTDYVPYEGWEVHGLPVTTILRGEVIVDQGRAVAGEPHGRLVRRYLNRGRDAGNTEVLNV
jgi:dihydropyrimidinase